MESHLTNSDKYELLDIDMDGMCEEIRHEMIIKEFYRIKPKEIAKIQEAIGNCLELEIDVDGAQGEPTRLSFYTLHKQIVVIRKKQIDIKLLFELLVEVFPFSAGDNEEKIRVILIVLLKTFLNVLDEETSVIYAYLCKAYFVNHQRFGNIEIYDEVNQYLRQYLGAAWSKDKIHRILRQLEGLRVIEFREGMLEVKDKIYLG
jgi:hypothetical protein